MPSDNKNLRGVYYQIADNKALVDKALKEAENQDIIIMSPRFSDYDRDDDLDIRWERYNQMTKPFKRRSDWITLEFFGLTNQDIYEIMKGIKMESRIYNTPIINPIGSSDEAYNESTIKDEYDMTETDRLRGIIDALTGDDLIQANNKAKDYMAKTGFIMICPANTYLTIKELDDEHERFEMMIHDHQRQSNWMMEEIYGYTNYEYYKYMYHMLSQWDGFDKSIYNDVQAIGESSRAALNYGKVYLNSIIENDGTPNEIAESIANILSLPGTYESIIAGEVISDALDKYDGLTANVATINLNVSDLPMYTPDEMIDAGIYTGDEAVDNSEWFVEYCDYFYSGICSNSFLEHNLERVRELEKWKRGLSDIDPFKFGWNPHIPFTEENRIIADRRMLSVLSEKMNTTTFIDLRGFEAPEIRKINLEANSNTNSLKPIFIALEEGKTPIFSDGVRLLSKGKFSHAMISFDSSMETLYSYGMDGAVRKLGGFIIESIKNKRKDSTFKLYCFFVKNDVFDTMKKNVEWFIDNQKKTIYSWHKLFAYIFNIPTSSDNIDFICSEFVDKMLKLGGLDLTKMNSNLVAPNDIDRAAKKNRKVYTLFNDKIAKYDKNKIDRLVAKIALRAKPVNEFSLYSMAKTPFAFNTCTKIGIKNLDILSELSSYVGNNAKTDRNDAIMALTYSRLLMPCLEAREIPIKITDHGDLIIRNLAPLDFEAAYAKSHKLLMEYVKAENIEGMKKELAYMWYLNLVLEKRIHTPTVKEAKRKEFEKARAKVLNDFKTYIKVVQKYDKDFDFRTYFEESDYSDAAYKISGPTIKAAFDLIKKLI